MAKLLSQVATVLRGSIGGITFFATRTQAICARARVGPARIPTNNQTIIRTILTSLQGKWKDLPVAVRQGWADYADTVVLSGPTGTYTLTGLQMYIRTLSVYSYGLTRNLSTLALSNVAPILPGLPDIGPITQADYISVGTGVALSVSNGIGFDATAFTRVTGPWGPGRLKSPNNWDSDRDLYTACPNGQSTLVEIENLVEDAIYFVSVRMLLDDSPLRVDPEFTYRAIAVTNVI